MTDIAEAMKGFTDLPISLLALIFGLLLIKKDEKKDRSIIFLFIAVSAALGTFVHAVKLPDLAVKITWLVLYPVLYESIRRFALFFLSYIRCEKLTEQKSVFVCEAIILFVNEIGVFLFPKYDILFLVIFGLYMIFRVTFFMIRTKNVPKKAYFLMFLLLIPVGLQAFESVIPYAVVIEHFFIFSDMIFVYFL